MAHSAPYCDLFLNMALAAYCIIESVSMDSGQAVFNGAGGEPALQGRGPTLSCCF